MRDQLIHNARVYLAEARSRRDSRFFWTLIGWAASARRRAVEASTPAQGDLF